MSIIRREQLITPLSASYATTASIATSSSYAATASYAENAGVSVDTGSLLATASVSLNTITFTKGDGSTFPIVVDTGSTDINGLVTTSSFNAYTASINNFTSSVNAFTASYNTGSFSGSFIGDLQGTASWANNAISSSYTLSSSQAQYADTASNILGGKATHVPFFITDTTLATSSIYQSGSSTVIINQDNATSANPEALFVWQPSTSSFNVISGKGNLNNYLQLNIQNTNQGIDASSDVVATANNGSEVDNYIDMGINNENFAGFLGGPNDAYLYAHSNDLWIGNVNNGHKVYFFNSSSEQPIITLNSNNAEVTGSLHGTASWANNAVFALSANVFPFTGSAIISGSLTVTGSTNLSGTTGTTVFSTNADTLTITGSLTVTGSAIITGSLNVSGSITGSLFGTSSWAVSASQALTASFVQTAQTASYVLQAVSASFTITASYIDGGFY